MELRCQYCGGTMVKTVVSTGNVAGIALALLVLGAGCLISLTGVLAIIGIPICILALFMGGKRQKVWRCRTCKAIIPRA